MNTKNYLFYISKSQFKPSLFFCLIGAFLIFSTSGCKKNNKEVKLSTTESIKIKPEDSKLTLTNNDMVKSAQDDFSNFINDNLDSHTIYNIPIPVKTNIVASSNDEIKSSSINWYESYLDSESVVNFYNKTLEFEGWEIEDLSSEAEGLIIARKPTKSCAISIRPGQYGELKSKIGIFARNSSPIILDILK